MMITAQSEKGKTMTDREKMVKLLCEANSISVDAELFEDSSYAQQLEIEADFLIANGVTIPVRCKDCKYWKPGDSFGGDSLDDMQRIGRCPIVRFARREKDFCCEGERRTET